MIGFLRASSRFFRDRRVLLGSFLAVLLSFVSIMGLNAFLGERTLDGSTGILFIMAGFFWPMLWGMILATTIPMEEYRQGTLELLLMTPITPRRLVVAMSIAPIVITTILYTAVSPGLLFIFTLKNETSDLHYVLWTVALFQPVTWLVILSSIWESASKKTSGFPRTIAYVAFLIFLFSFILFLHEPKQHYFQIFLLVISTANMIFSLFSYLYKSIPFSLEEMNSTHDSTAKPIGGYLTIRQNEKETLFEQEEGISTYETLEQIRQQTRGGPLLQEKSVRKFTLIALLLFSQFVFIFYLLPRMTVFSFLCSTYCLFLFLSLIYSASLAMREMLEERSTLRLDSLRVSMLPIEEITQGKERIANLLPFTVLKWCLAFSFAFSLLENFSLLTLFTFAILALQTWLALSFTARMGIWLGLSARDELEGSLWIALLFLFWIFLPYMGMKFLVIESLHPAFTLAIHSLAGISPLYVIHWLTPDAYLSVKLFYILGGLAMQGLVGWGINRWNQRRIGMAW